MHGSNVPPMIPRRFAAPGDGGAHAPARRGARPPTRRGAAGAGRSARPRTRRATPRPRGRSPGARRAPGNIRACPANASARMIVGARPGWPRSMAWVETSSRRWSGRRCPGASSNWSAAIVIQTWCSIRSFTDEDLFRVVPGLEELLVGERLDRTRGTAPTPGRPPRRAPRLVAIHPRPLAPPLVRVHVLFGNELEGGPADGDLVPTPSALGHQAALDAGLDQPALQLRYPPCGPPSPSRQPSAPRRGR